MMILQAIISLVTRFTGKLFSTLFGWAVTALFGQPTPNEQTRLSILVAASAAWPVLLLGTVFPRIAAFTLAFVPLSKKIPSSVIRPAWIFLALVVPLVLGIVLSRRAPPPPKPESPLKRLLRGFPITAALAGAFLFLLVATPFRKVSSIIKGIYDDFVPLIVKPETYHETADQIVEVLKDHGLPLERAEPTWVMKAPMAILRALGGEAFRGFVPDRLEYFRSPTLDLLLEPNGVTLRGDQNSTPRAHGLIAERLTRTEVLQTFDPQAQVIEREIKDVWKVYGANPAHQDSPVLLARVDAIAKEILGLPVAYGDWQTLYRETLQLARAVRGEPQLLSKDRPKEDSMTFGSTTRNAAPRPDTKSPLEQMPLAELIGSISDKAGLLVEKEVTLAKTEIKADLKSELEMVKGLAIAAAALLLGINMLLVALVFVLADRMAPWLAALAIAAPLIVLAAVAGAVGWSKRVTTPLEMTRATIKENVEWTRNRLS